MWHSLSLKFYCIITHINSILLNRKKALLPCPLAVFWEIRSCQISNGDGFYSFYSGFKISGNGLLMIFNWIHKLCISLQYHLVQPVAPMSQTPMLHL